MKKIVLLTWGLICIINIQAQEIGKINLGVVVPEQIEDLDISQIGKLKTKIERICTENGISNGFTNNGFVIYPAFEVYESDIIESGMQKIYSVKIELSLFIKQIGGASVNSITKSYRGSGNSRSKAIVSAIGNITPNDAEFKKFIGNGKIGILNYYTTYCEKIIAKSEQMAKQEQYDEALSLLFSIPEEVSCYKEVANISEHIFNLYQTQQCKQILSAAKSAIAIQNYLEAADILWQINPNSSCYAESQQTIKDLETKVNDKEKRDWDYKMQQHKDAVILEQNALDAAKEVAKAYYSNQPILNYTQVIH